MSVWNITGTALRFITLHYFFQENAYAYKIHGQIRVQYIVQALTSAAMQQEINRLEQQANNSNCTWYQIVNVVFLTFFVAFSFSSFFCRFLIIFSNK